MAISNVMTRSLLSAGSAMKQVRAQEGIKKQMEGKAGVLKAEIKQDSGRGGDTAKKEEEQNSIGKVNEQAAVYEKKSDDSSNKAAYEIAKKSPADRAAIVQQMKAAEEQQRNQLMAIVQKTLQGQVGAYGKATGNNMWQQLAGGNVKVDAATRAQAQKDISEDGYYGVKQTSQRLFDFAAALAGDDVDKMKEMQKAMEKGFKQATKTWGRELPAICKETMNAANKLFEDYYSSKEQAV